MQAVRLPLVLLEQPLYTICAVLSQQLPSPSNTPAAQPPYDLHAAQQASFESAGAFVREPSPILQFGM
jgi:hypothetical protein